MGCYSPIIVSQIEADLSIRGNLGCVEAGPPTPRDKPHHSPWSLCASLPPLPPRHPRRRRNIDIASETLSSPPCDRSRRRAIASLRHGPFLAGQAAIADAAAGETGCRRGGGRQFQAQSRTRLGAGNPLARSRGSLRPHPTVVRAEGRNATSAAAAKVAVSGRRQGVAAVARRMQTRRRVGCSSGAKTADTEARRQ